MEKGLKDIQDRVDRAVEKAISQSFLSELGKTAADGLVTRTRLGKGTDGAGLKQRKLKKLSLKYKRQRKKDDLSALTTPSKSNLTRTGQMLNAITSRARPGGAQIFFKENRNDGKKNIKIVGYQEDQDRPFFYLSKPELVNIRRITRQRLLDIMGKL